MNSGERGVWQLLQAEGAYWTAEEWAGFTKERQARELAAMDNADAFAQAGIIAAAERRPVWSVINDWTAADLLEPLDQRRAA